MISSSIWHCDYCLGDICCCIKSNLPFLSSIVTVPELFSFFRGGGDDLKEHTRKAAQPSLWLRNTQTHPVMVFALCQTPGLTDFPFSQQGHSFSSLCVHLDVTFPCTAVGLPTLPIVLVTPAPRNRWSSLQLGPYCFRKGMSLSSGQVKRPFSGWLHQGAGEGFRLHLKRLMEWGAAPSPGWEQHSAPCKDTIQKLKAAAEGEERETRKKNIN